MGIILEHIVEMRHLGLRLVTAHAEPEHVGLMERAMNLGLRSQGFYPS